MASGNLRPCYIESPQPFLGDRKSDGPKSISQATTLHARTTIIGPLCLLREGIESTLRRSGFEVLLEVSDVGVLTPELWSLAETSDIFVLLSYNEAPLRLIALIEHLHQRAPSSAIVVLGERDFEDSVDARAAGAHDYFPTTLRPDALIQALSQIVAGGLQRTPLITSLDALPEGPLSPREREVLQALSLGESNKHIARRLGISDATVKAHIRLILKKTGSDNRTQAALWALAHRDVSPSL